MFPLLGLAPSLALLAGVSLAQLLPALPRIAASVALLALAIVLDRRARLLAVLIGGFAWATLRGAIALEQRLPAEREGIDTRVTGQVVGLPQPQPGGVRFELAPDDSPGIRRLAWYSPAFMPRAGQRIEATVRLRRPHGLADPGAFDFERHALERGIAATGYVREARALTPRGAGLDALRERFSREIARRLGHGSVANLLRALSVGDQAALSDADWEVLRATGTPHLVAISGFHVGVVAGLGALLARALFFVLPALALRVPRQQAAALAALGAATAYSAVAGFSLPVERTLLMIAAVALTRLLRRQAAPTSGFALALWVLLVADPLAVLGVGFWLSFAGVAWLVWSLGGRTGHPGVVEGFGRAQWAVTLGLTPLSLFFFQQCSVSGPLANLVAIPWITLVVVPLLLLAFGAWLALPVAFAPLLAASDLAARAIWWVLAKLAAPSWSVVHLPEPTLAALVLATAGAALALLPRGFGTRALGAIALLAALVAPDRAPPRGAFDLVQVDVGQGLSLLVRTADHALLFDAGGGVEGGWDMGDSAVLPSLRALGVARLDALVVSHGDNDHAGGAPSVIAAYDPPLVLRGDGKFGARQCVAGTHWRWDEVDFELLHPPRDFPYLRNASSCVLRIRAGPVSALLPGDIPAEIERRLVREQASSLASTVLVAPHHGSRGSSSDAFLNAVRPSLVLVSAGYRSRFGHPHAEALARYAAIGARVLNSADAGFMRVRVDPVRGIDAPWRYRAEVPRYWRDRPAGT